MITILIIKKILQIIMIKKMMVFQIIIKKMIVFQLIILKKIIVLQIIKIIIWVIINQILVRINLKSKRKIKNRLYKIIIYKLCKKMFIN